MRARVYARTGQARSRKKSFSRVCARYAPQNGGICPGFSGAWARVSVESVYFRTMQASVFIIATRSAARCDETPSGVPFRRSQLY